MTKVRYVVLTGGECDYHAKVECAELTDRSQPARDFLHLLAKAAWPEGFEAHLDPATDPVNVYYKLRARMKFVLEHGYPAQNGDVNCLKNGFWEFRYDRLRVGYFDVDEDGNHTSREWVDDRREVDPDFQDENWKYPQLDRILRLTHGFVKTGEQTSDADLEMLDKTREEDLFND